MKEHRWGGGHESYKNPGDTLAVSGRLCEGILKDLYKNKKHIRPLYSSVLFLCLWKHTISQDIENDN